MANTSVLPSTYSTAGLISVDGRTYPLKSARIDARAEGGVAATTFVQTYGNPYQEPLEVFYTLPLPANGAVIGYSMHLGKRTIRGEVRRRAEAQQEYQRALFEGRAAALLEQNRADTFMQKLGSLPPGETAQIEIEVLQPLAFLPADGEIPARWEYRFPTVAGVRYEGAEGRVPDAEKLDADRAEGEGTPVRLEASILIADGSTSLIHPHAPGQEIGFDDIEGGVKAVLREKMKLDRDLVIRWTAAQRNVGVRLVEGKGLPCDNGRYVLITLTPPGTVGKGLSRDLTLLIDASGSMSGKPISRAKIMAEQLLRSLDPGDRFEILAFSNDVRRLVSKPVQASAENLRKALTELDKLEAGGGTEMARAIVEALKPLRSDSQRQVILLSDGYIGFEGEVIGEIMRRLVPGARLHAIGIGSAPNRTLTRGAARAGRGIEVLVGDDDDARTASRRLLQATVRPVLTDLEIDGSALVALAPGKPQDVLAGQPLVLLAEIASTGGRLELRGKEAGTVNPWVHSVEIPGTQEVSQGVEQSSQSLQQTSLPIGALFGRESIEDLELQLAAAPRGQATGTLETRIENVGLRHGIASRMTSLVAISEDPTVDPRDPRRRERLAVELPAEVSAEGVGLAQPSFAFGAARMSSALMNLSSGPYLGEESRAMMLECHSSEVALRRKVRARGSLLGRLGFSIRPRKDTLRISETRILKLDGRILIFEFEVPAQGIQLPDDKTKVHVVFDDGSARTARVLGDQSSPPGPHRPRVTVRVALKIEGDSSWQSGGARLSWSQPDGRETELHVTLE